MKDDDFHTKEHITKHLTGADWKKIRERTRVNSAPEQAFLNWAEFTAVTLRTDEMSPQMYKLYMAGERLYNKAHGSFKFGVIAKVKGKWLWLLIGGVVAFVVILFLTGTLSMGG